MSRISQKLTENIYQNALRTMMDLDKKSLAAIKLQAIISAKKAGIKKVSEIFGYNKNSLHLWIKKFTNNGINGLENISVQRKKMILSADNLKTISDWIKKEPNLTINAVKIRIKNEFNVEISKSTVHNYLKKLKFSYITPRPKHYLQKPEKIAEFINTIGEKN